MDPWFDKNSKDSLYFDEFSTDMPLIVSIMVLGFNQHRMTRDTLGTARHQSLSIPGHTHLHVVLLEVHLEAEVAVHVGAVTRGDDDPVLDPVGSSRDVLELEQDRVVGVTPRP